VDTLAEKGWSEKSNGELLHLAEREGYEVSVTTEQSIRFQQNLAGMRLTIVLLATAWPRVQHRIAEIRAAIADTRPGELREVPIPPIGLT